MSTRRSRRVISILVTATVLAALPSPRASAQSAPRPAAEEKGSAAAAIADIDYWKNYVRVPFKFLATPFHWGLGDWGKAALVGLGVGGVMLLDEDIKDFVQDDLRASSTDKLADLVEPLGDRTVALALTGGGYLVGATIGNRRLASTSLIGLQSVAVASSLSEGIKQLAHRERPKSTDDAFDFGGPTGSGGKSFVSGHAAHAFSVATVFAMEYSELPAIPPLAYGLATLTAFSRVNDNRHWASDVVVGGGLGFLIGVLAYKMSPFRKGTAKVTLRPFIHGDARGVSAAMRF